MKYIKLTYLSLDKHKGRFKESCLSTLTIENIKEHHWPMLTFNFDWLKIILFISFYRDIYFRYFVKVVLKYNSIVVPPI